MVGEESNDIDRMAIETAEVLTADRAAARREAGRLFAKAVSLSRPMVVEKDGCERFPARAELGCGDDQGEPVERVD